MEGDGIQDLLHRVEPFWVHYQACKLAERAGTDSPIASYIYQRIAPRGLSTDDPEWGDWLAEDLAETGEMLRRLGELHGVDLIGTVDVGVGVA